MKHKTGRSADPASSPKRLPRSKAAASAKATTGQTPLPPDREHPRVEESSWAGDQQFRALFESVPIGMGIADQRGNLLVCNRAMRAYGGYSREDVQKIGHISALYCDATEREKVLALLAHEGVVKKYPVRFKRKDGSAYDALLSLSPTTFNGQAGVLAVVEDITEHKRAEEALERVRKDSQTILDAAPVMIAYKNKDDHFVWVNSAFANFVGLPKEEIIGATTFDVVAQHDVAQRGRDHDLEVMRTGKPIVNQLIKWSGFHSGREIWAVYSKLPFCDSDGSIIGTVSYVADVDERVRTEVALRESAEQHRTILQTAMDGFWLVDMQGRLLEVNEAYCRMSGYSAQELRAMRIPDLEAVKSADAITAHIEKIVAQGEDRFESRHRRKDGTVFDFEASVQYRPGEGGRLVAFLHDITHRKRAEAEQAALQNQLAQAQKIESVGRLAGGVAHDFNNMLGVILGHVELALAQVDPAQPLHADLEEIHKASMRSADLTRQLLAFARKQTVTPTVLDLNETLAGMLQMLRRLIGENIDLRWQPAADLWPVKVDQSQISQILANLCINARDAIAGVGTLTIATGNSTLDQRYCALNAGCAPGDYVLLTLTDTGCGMNTEALSHLFEPFFTTKAMGKGTGLGLATVYGIVKQNDGFIYADSEPNQGTTFRIYLPRHVGRNGEARTEGAERPVPRGHETILLVEDEPAILTLARRMLEQRGYTVLTATAPGEAVGLAKEHAGEIDLLITDVIMPEMNGRALASSLLALYPGLKCLFMSGYTADVIAHHGVLNEGVHFIQKPFSMKDLASKVREALGALD